MAKQLSYILLGDGDFTYSLDMCRYLAAAPPSSPSSSAANSGDGNKPTISNITGGPGAGQLCKLANQIAIASGMVAMAEALAFARANQLDLEAVLKALSGGGASSWALLNLAPRVLKGDFAPGFYVKHIIKDMRIALDSAAELKLDLPGLAEAKRLYEKVAARGWEECGTQALYRLYLAP